MNQIAPQDKSHVLTIGQLVLSLVGLGLLLLGFVGLSILLLLPTQAEIMPFDAQSQLRQMLWVVATLILLTIPSLVAAIRCLNGLPAKKVPLRGFLFASISLIVTALVVTLWVSFATDSLTHALGGLVSVLVVFMPLWWFLELGRLGLSRISAQRQWGAATFGNFVTLPTVLIMETVVLAIGVIIASIWLIQQPEFLPYLQQFEPGMPFDFFNLQGLDIDWLALVQHPFIITAIVIGASLTIPLIEELLKPLGMWFLRKRQFSPSSGFIIGMICGAMFAFVESSFSLSAVTSNDWLFTAIGRVGTNLLHLTLTGFNGWALFSTWLDGKYLRLGITYLVTVIVHGIWNLFALLMGLNTIGGELSLAVSPTLTAAAQWVLIGLSLAMFAALIFMNAHLRKEKPHNDSPPPMPIPMGN